MDRESDRDSWNFAWAIACLLVAVWGFAGCTAHAPAPQTETVGQLQAGPSVRTAPLKHDPPPSLGFVAGSGDDDVSSTVSTVTRAVDVEAPAVVAKDQGLTLGGTR